MFPELDMTRIPGSRTVNRTVRMYAVPGGALLVASLLAVAVLGAQAGRKGTGVVVAAATEQPVPNASVQYADQDGALLHGSTTAPIRCRSRRRG